MGTDHQVLQDRVVLMHHRRDALVSWIVAAASHRNGGGRVPVDQWYGKPAVDACFRRTAVLMHHVGMAVGRYPEWHAGKQ